MSGPEQQSTIADAVEASAQKFIKAERRARRRWTALVIVVLGLALLVVDRGHQVINQVQRGAYMSCISENTARATNRDVWDAFIELLLKGDTSKADQAKGHGFEKLVAMHEAPQNCTSLYGASHPWWEAWSM